MIWPRRQSRSVRLHTSSIRRVRGRRAGHVLDLLRAHGMPLLVHAYSFGLARATRSATVAGATTVVAIPLLEGDVAATGLTAAVTAAVLTAWWHWRTRDNRGVGIGSAHEAQRVEPASRTWLRELSKAPIAVAIALAIVLAYREVFDVVEPALGVLVGSLICVALVRLRDATALARWERSYGVVVLRDLRTRSVIALERDDHSIGN